MNSIQVKSLPLKDVIRDIAHELGGEVQHDCDEYYIQIPSNHGEGIIRGINFNGGMGLVIYDCTFKENLEIRFTAGKIHSLKFIYCIEGELNHCFEEDETELHHLQQHERVIVASSHHDSHILTFSGGVHTRIGSLEILRSKFKYKIECEADKLDKDLKALFGDQKALSKFFEQGNYSLALEEIFEDIENFDGEGILRKFFLEGKAYDILTQQIILFGNSVEKDKTLGILRNSELEAIKRASSHIEENTHSSLIVQHLARDVGLSTAKLQQGFKLLKGTTVNRFITDVRLSKARHLLLTSDMNISEIVYKIGLTNRGYFSRIFKERYGVSPSTFRYEKQSKTVK